jgi:hypothetical protein
VKDERSRRNRACGAGITRLPLPPPPPLLAAPAGAVDAALVEEVVGRLRARDVDGSGGVARRALDVLSAFAHPKYTFDTTRKCYV